ncbi:TolC family protein [Carboxylicivirga linearis]|uniref:TolC family protein n=1 Tax=Carboxylicivirga linearis TaxID=1628157 RepID=A0ABS5JZX8_9BACT|nr:TolC family protein [Carboxylicivirga linearis]MBS2100443.1 TolC family protein [Carboxylicivirga linearis]
MKPNKLRYQTLLKSALSILLILLGWAGNNVLAQDNLDHYLTLAAENNPSLKAAFNKYMAALEKAPQVSALPDPQIAFAYFIQPVETRVGPQEFKISASQMFPWFGTLQARENAAISNAKAEYEMFEQQKSKLFQEVKANWYNIYFNQKAIDITLENMTILQSFRGVATAKVEAGKVSAADQYRIEMEINDLENELAQLRDAQSLLTTSFKNLIGTTSEIAVGDTIISTDLLLRKEAIMDSIKAKNHVLLSMDLNTSALEYQKEAAQKAGGPNFSIGIDYTFIGKGENNLSGKDAILFPKIGFSIPLYRKKYKSIVQEVVYQQEAVTNDKSNQTNILENILEKSYNEMTDAERRLRLFEKQLLLSSKSLRIIETEYANQNSNFEEMLRMQKRMLKYQLELEKARTDKLASIAFIYYLMGK